MGVLVNYREISGRPENATSSASAHLWNGRLSAEPQGLHLWTKGRRPCHPLPLKPWSGPPGEKRQRLRLLRIPERILLALMLGFGRPFSSHRSLGLYIGAVPLADVASPSSRPPRPLSLSSISPSGRSGKGLVRKSAGLAKDRKNDKEERSRERLGLTLAITTCSSVTFNGSVESEGAKTYDLVNPLPKHTCGEITRQEVDGLGLGVHRRLSTSPLAL
ncbi:hypothetical protein Cgig2_007537 [Carnegiea gigantea]|uniref:Uncharacterized protein n=1 Tax=Carnegiea gigantea TaxID=171969 RepID=A0A9Q1QCL3_9CARY|nr:hypothetical protein Cgig2_007537 [Carnegiea gigantea]